MGHGMEHPLLYLTVSRNAPPQRCLFFSDMCIYVQSERKLQRRLLCSHGLYVPMLVTLQVGNDNRKGLSLRGRTPLYPRQPQGLVATREDSAGSLVRVAVELIPADGQLT